MPRRGSLGPPAERCSGEPWLGLVLCEGSRPTPAPWRSVSGKGVSNDSDPLPAFSHTAEGAPVCDTALTPRSGQCLPLTGMVRGRAAVVTSVHRGVSVSAPSVEPSALTTRTRSLGLYGVRGSQV